MVEMAVAQDQPVERACVEIEEGEIAVEDLRRVAEIEEVLRGYAGALRLEMQREAPFAGQGRAFVAADMPCMLDPDGGMLGVGDEAVVIGIDDDAHAEPVDGRGD